MHRPTHTTADRNRISRRRIWPLLLLWVSVAHTGCAHLPSSDPAVSAKEEEAVRTIALVINTVDGRPDIWPGYSLHEMPVLIFRPAGRSFLLNAGTPQPQLQRIAVPGVELDIWEVPRDLLQVSASTPFTIGFEFLGKTVFLVRHDDNTSAESFFRLAAHELFHDYQRKHFAKRTYPKDCRYPIENIPHAQLARAEELALVQALKPTPEGAEGPWLGRYVGLRLLRMASEAGQKAGPIELWEEALEGSARYVEEQAAMAVGLSSPQKAVQSIASFFSRFSPGSLQKWKYYRTGAAMGMALDYLEVDDWKTRCERGDDMFEMVSDALAEAEILPEAPQLETFATLPDEEARQVTAAITKYMDQEIEVEKKWRDAGAYRIELKVERKSKAYYVNNGLTYATANCGRMVGGIRSYIDHDTKLEIFNRPILMTNSPDKSNLVFYVDLDTNSIQLDTRILGLKDGDYPFSHSLLVSSKGFRINTKASGHVTVSGNTILIEIAPVTEQPNRP